MPEKLTNCMLERFQVNGAQPLLESRVREMITTSINTSHEALQAAVLEKFLQAFQAMCRRLLAGLPDEQIDAKRMPDKSYMTIYRKLSVAKLLRKQVTRKRKRGEVSQEDL